MCLICVASGIMTEDQLAGNDAAPDMSATPKVIDDITDALMEMSKMVMPSIPTSTDDLGHALADVAIKLMNLSNPYGVALSLSVVLLQYRKMIEQGHSPNSPVRPDMQPGMYL